MSVESTFIFRRANIEDIKEVLQMIQELADFEKMSDGPQLTEEDLIRDAGLNGGKEFCHIYILDLMNGNCGKAIPIGYAICFFSYSTWKGRSYFLEDLYVRPEYRGIGAGARLFGEIVTKAKEYGSKQLDFHVLEWNPARTFYEKMGATDLSQTEQWHFYRMKEQQIDKMTEELKQKLTQL